MPPKQKESLKSSIGDLLQSPHEDLHTEGMSHRERMKQRRKQEAHNLYYTQYPQRAQNDPAHKVISNMYHQQLDLPKPPQEPIDTQKPIPQEPLVDNLLRGTYYAAKDHVKELDRPHGLGKGPNGAMGTSYLFKEPRVRSRLEEARYENAMESRNQKMKGGNVEDAEEDALLFSGFCPVDTKDSSAGPGNSNEDWAVQTDPAPWSKGCCEEVVPDTKVVCGRHVEPVGGQPMFKQSSQLFRVAPHAGKVPQSTLVNTTSGKQVHHQGTSCTPADMYPQRPFSHGQHDKAVERARDASWYHAFRNTQTTTDGIDYKKPVNGRPFTASTVRDPFVQPASVSANRHLDVASMATLHKGRFGADEVPQNVRRFQNRPRDTMSLF